MSFLVSLYPKLYLEEEDSSWSARPNTRLLNLLHRLNDNEGSARWIAVLGTTRIALGDPVTVSNSTNCMLFLPQWILDSVEGFQGIEMEIRFERSETLPKATRLGFKIIGEMPPSMDLKELLEEPLSQLGVLHQGQIIPVPILDNIYLIVQTCESDSSNTGPVFLDGAEISLEIEDEEKEEQGIIETPPFTHQTEATGKFSESDTEEISMLPQQQIQASSGFIPFQGIGRRLCD